jgi:hypothetical protein
MDLAPVMHVMPAMSTEPPYDTEDALRLRVQARQRRRRDPDWMRWTLGLFAGLMAGVIVLDVVEGGRVLAPVNGTLRAMAPVVAKALRQTADTLDQFARG